MGQTHDFTDCPNSEDTLSALVRVTYTNLFELLPTLDPALSIELVCELINLAEAARSLPAD